MSTIKIIGKVMRKLTQERLQACINFGAKKWLKAMYIIATISEFNIINFT